MWENTLFCKKAGFCHTLSGKKLLDYWRQITESHNACSMEVLLGRAARGRRVLCGVVPRSARDSSPPGSCFQWDRHLAGHFCSRSDRRSPFGVPEGLPNSRRGCQAHGKEDNKTDKILAGSTNTMATLPGPCLPHISFVSRAARLRRRESLRKTCFMQESVSEPLKHSDKTLDNY